MACLLLFYVAVDAAGVTAFRKTAPLRKSFPLIKLAPLIGHSPLFELGELVANNTGPI